ncbi:MAG: cell division protein FtsZ [Candidatus Eisenbacteria bacterium]
MTKNKKKGGRTANRGSRRRSRGPQEVSGMKLQLEFEPEQTAKIKVIGVGGAGGNAVNRMIESGFTGVDFVAINTDAQALGCCLAPDQVQVGRELTHGLGSGGNPEVGRRAAEEDAEAVAGMLKGADMVFIAAGMGGGTGTGGAPVVAKMAKNMGALVVAVVSKPFLFEGQYRMRQAVEGLKLLRDEVDTSIVIPNQRLLAVASKDTPIREAFRIADDVLLRATRGVSDLIMVPGLVNLDFADVRSVMTGMGDAVMGTGVSAGKNRAVESAQQAISSPLLEDQSIVGAAGVLVNVTGGPDLTLHEINEAAMIINEAIGAESNMIFGAVINDNMKDEVMITVIATGINSERKKARPEARGEERPEVRRLRPRPAASEPPVSREPEPAPRNQLVARSSRRGSKRDLEIPTFLRRQMD